jgi:hypothetical protein
MRGDGLQKNEPVAVPQVYDKIRHLTVLIDGNAKRPENLLFEDGPL